MSKEETQNIYNAFSFSAIIIAIMVLLSSFYDVSLCEYALIMALFSLIVLIYRKVYKQV